MKHFKIISEKHPKLKHINSKVSHLFEVPNHTSYITAPEEGVFELFFKLGDKIKEGDAVGQLHFLDNPTREPLILKSSRSGVLFARRAPAKADSGDCLAVIAQPL